jgi:hypothetical protein
MPRRWPSYPRLLGLSALALLSIAGSLIFTAAHNRSLAAAFGFTGVGLSLAAFTWAVVLMAQRRLWLWMVYLVTALGYSVISLFFPSPIRGHFSDSHFHHSSCSSRRSLVQQQPDDARPATIQWVTLRPFQRLKSGGGKVKHLRTGYARLPLARWRGVSYQAMTPPSEGVPAMSEPVRVFPSYASVCNAFVAAREGTAWTSV